jgi:hypothetical protein
VLEADDFKDVEWDGDKIEDKGLYDRFLEDDGPYDRRFNRELCREHPDPYDRLLEDNGPFDRRLNRELRRTRPDPFIFSSRMMAHLIVVSHANFVASDHLLMWTLRPSPQPRTSAQADFA